MGYMMRILRGIVFSLLFLANCLQAQEYQDTAVYVVARGEDVRISLAWTSANHGLIQWQVSAGNDNWTDIPEANTKNLRLKADSGIWLRAKITSGTCDPLFSILTGLNVLDIRTLKTDSITDNRALVFCSVDTSAGGITEKGVLIDTKAIPDSTSTHIKDTASETNYSVELKNLLPGKKYYVRAYEKLRDGKLLMGNILDFTTYMIEAINRTNITDSTATVWYRITGDTSGITHGVFYNVSMPDTNSLQQPGQFDGNKWRSVLPGLHSGTSYYAVPYVRIYNQYHLGVPIHFTTYTDYSQEVVDTTAFQIGHKIEWKPYATAKKISQSGFYADYGRVKRIGDSDTLLLVYHGGENNQDWLNVYMRKSYDNGETWQDQQVMAEYRSLYKLLAFLQSGADPACQWMDIAGLYGQWKSRN